MAKKRAKFDRAAFVEDLAGQIAEILRRRAAEFKANSVGAIALDTHPWHRGTMLSVLLDTDASRKWDLGGWEHQEFGDLGGERLEAAYDALRNPKIEGSKSYHPFFLACAEAICHLSVMQALSQYTLAEDFECFVGDPDDSNDVNFCEQITGVNPKKRKGKKEIVDDLDEAMKSPEAVESLKYWFHETFTEEDDRRIGRLVNLKALHLNEMGLESLPGCISRLEKLTELHLDDNRLASLSGLHKLADLQKLHLRHNKSLTPEMIAELAATRSLRQLYVGDCGLSEVPPAFQQLVNLEGIYLFDNPLALIPDWLPALPNLKKLGLVDAADDKVKARLKEKHPHLEIW